MIVLYLEPHAGAVGAPPPTVPGRALCWNPQSPPGQAGPLSPPWLKECASEVTAVNAALRQALRQDEDIIVIGRDCAPTAQSLAEMAAFSRSTDADPMVMFAAPRDQGGVVTGLRLPPGAPGATLAALRRLLPPHTYVPRLFPSYVLLKTAFLKEIGLLDEAYATWPAAVDDMALRANAFGFRSLMLNHVFVPSASAPPNSADEELLAARFPEAGTMLEEFQKSARRVAERQICRLLAPGRRLVAFDFSYFSTGHDGTNEAGIALLRSAAAVCKDVDFAVIASPAVWDAHGLASIDGLRRLEPGAIQEQPFAIIRMGQPWRQDELPPLFRSAPIVAFFMLDAIGYDCQYIAAQVPGLDDLWSFVATFADAVFTQSRFTLRRLEERFHFDDRCLRRVTHHSLDTTDYGRPAAREGKHVLVVGNHFKHKFVTPTVDALAPRFPDRSFVAIGYTGDRAWPNVTCLTSGALPDEEFSALYDQAQCVIFPSVYEGFGFPVLHALARRKAVYVRRSPLYDELQSLMAHGGNVHQFKDIDDLAQQLARADSTVFVPGAKAPGRVAPCDVRGWERSAREVLAALEACAQRVDYERLVERNRWCNLLRG